MKISYTKMRDDLANVLDVLRSGEEVTITQRGKPDIIINAHNAVSAQPNWKKSNSEVKHKVASDAYHLGYESGMKVGVRSPVKPLSFSEAKTRTQNKHAGIIKALEDK